MTPWPTPCHQGPLKRPPRDELMEMRMAYIQELRMSQEMFVESDESTFSYEFRAAVVARDYDALVLDPPIIEDSDRQCDDNSGEGDEDN